MRFPSFPMPSLPHPLDLLPTAINHLLAAEPWARAQLAPHLGKTLDVVVDGAIVPLTIRLSVAPDGSVARAVTGAVADTTVTIPAAALPRMLAGGADAILRDVRIDGDADFAQAVSVLMKNLRWDVEEDLSKVIGDAASHRAAAVARGAQREVRKAGEKATANVTEYLLEENPQLVRPRAVALLGEGVRRLRDDVARLEKRVERLTHPSSAPVSTSVPAAR